MFLFVFVNSANLSNNLARQRIFGWIFFSFKTEFNTLFPSGLQNVILERQCKSLWVSLNVSICFIPYIFMLLSVLFFVILITFCVRVLIEFVLFGNFLRVSWIRLYASLLNLEFLVITSFIFNFFAFCLTFPSGISMM